VLAIDMLRAGYAKAFVPQAAVLHSHRYTSLQQLRRSFDEWRGLLEVYDWREPASPRHLLSRMRGALGQADAALVAEQVPRLARLAMLAGVTAHQLASLCGALLGSRVDRLPARVRRGLSLERRADFAPLHIIDASGVGSDPAGAAPDRERRR
jgi:rhamnosyltransferase